MISVFGSQLFTVFFVLLNADASGSFDPTVDGAPGSVISGLIGFGLLGESICSNAPQFASLKEYVHVANAALSVVITPR